MKKYYVEEYQVEIDHDVDLSIYLQGKFLPVVYGVMRVPGIPVFADTLNNDPNTVYVAYALSEGEIQGIYNMYIDGNSLLCTDEADATTRGTGATGNTALTCYGRMDRGNVLGGTNIGGTLTFTEWLHENDLFEDYQEALDNNRESRFEAMYQDFLTANENNINNATAADLQQGIGHEISASIASPHDIDFTFHQGREFQKASSILATVAAGNNFKRQNSTIVEMTNIGHQTILY